MRAALAMAMMLVAARAAPAATPSAIVVATGFDLTGSLTRQPLRAALPRPLPAPRFLAPRLGNAPVPRHRQRSLRWRGKTVKFRTRF